MSDLASLPGIERAVTELETLCLRDAESKAMVVVEGEPTAGKSTVLSRFAQRARRVGGRIVVELTVPRAVQGPSEDQRYAISDDAGPVLLALAASQLSAVDPEPMRALEQQCSWNVLADLLRASLQTNGAIVVIDDLPATVSEPSFDSFFAQRVHEALKVLMVDGIQRVVSTALAGVVRGEHTISVTGSARAVEVLAEERWNGLGASARRARNELPETTLERLSPLELRLCVALLDAGAPPDELAGLRSRHLVRELFTRLGDQGAVLREVIGRLALERGPVDQRILDLAGASALEVDTRRLLEHAILFEEDGRYVLHETFAREAAAGSWLDPDRRVEAHRLFGRYHEGAFRRAAQTNDSASALRHELEAFHQLTQAGESGALEDVRALFTEQLDALGKALSLSRKFADAVTVYERAIERDAQDWYAHHYLAYNLDLQGIEPSRVEAEYVEARGLNRRHVWHHRRLACFYVTRGRSTRAREAWTDALSTLSPDTGGDDERLYQELHKPFARLLLHRGELAFARRVLDDVPAGLRARFDWWKALDRLHTRLTEAEREETVFPPDIALEERWASGPHTVPRDTGMSVSRWYPGRVSHVSPDEVNIRVAEAEGRFAWMDIPREAIAQEWRGSQSALAAGTFVEIVTWTSGIREILVHPPRRDQSIPRLHPPPDRYLSAQREGANGGAS